MAVQNIQIETSQLAESREVKSSQFWCCASGSEAAFNVLNISGEYLVDGKVLAKEVNVTGILNVRGEVEVL